MDKLTLLVDVRILSDKIKQLEADSKIVNRSLFATLKEVDELKAKNQRLTEAIEFEINQPMQIARQQERLQKALKGE